MNKQTLDNRMFITAYAFDHPDDKRTVPPPRREPTRSGLDDNTHNEVMTCGNCSFIGKSGRYKDLLYCSMGVACGLKQRECPVNPVNPGCDWWMSTIPVTDEDLDRLHQEAFHLPRRH